MTHPSLRPSQETTLKSLLHTLPQPPYDDALERRIADKMNAIRAKKQNIHASRSFGVYYTAAFACALFILMASLQWQNFNSTTPDALIAQTLDPVINHYEMAQALIEHDQEINRFVDDLFILYGDVL